MDGAELVESLREEPGFSSTPILILTARAGDEMPERMLRKGAQDYVVKPVGRGELLARVENLLELTGSRSLLQDALGAEEESLEELARMAASRKEQLERTVREKKILMRELHHRVKGNLQTITSLLKLQLRTVEDEGARRSLEESRGRVATMGLLHEKLYRSGDPDRVEMSDYLRSLVADVVRSRGAEGTVRTRLTLEEMELPVEDAIAGGLIVHELVTNALRHAFPSGGSGTVQVSLHREGGEAVLAVVDDGAGMPEGDGLPAETLGLQLVESLAGQLDGSVRIRTDEGTTVEIVFPVAEGEEARWRSSGPTGEDVP
jgi:two-component sensor histidine kinase